MRDQTLTLPEHPEELRSFAARLLAEGKAQAILIEKLRHQLAGHRAHRSGAASGTAEPLQLALDSNAAERSMRAVAPGRKNDLFVGAEAGGKAAAIACTLIEPAKLNAVDPQSWLADTLARIPDGKITKLDDLPPWHWNR